MAGTVCAVAACGAGSSPAFLTPVDPRLTVTQFLSAVEASDLATMAQLWGTSSGPALDQMDRGELDMRLTVMQRYLSHESYEITPVEATALSDVRTRLYQVRLTRRGCVVNVPFQVTRTGEGWLVSNVDLTQAGNPARSCGGGTPDRPEAFVIP